MTDPFADIEPVGPPRDRWKRPLIVPPDGGDRAPYTRASSFGDYISDKSAVHIWEQRALTKGMGDHEDLAALAASCAPIDGNKCDKASMSRAERKAHDENNAALDEIAERAKERAWRDYKADWGTAVHRFCDPAVNSGPVPARMDADVASFKRMLASRGAVILASEFFVVNDHFQVAGTADLLVRDHELGVGIWDIKTGQVDGKGLGFAVQLSMYAGGLLYDCDDDSRTPLESLTDGDVVSQSIGVIVHVPLGRGTTNLHTVNLDVGRHGAGLASRVRAARQLKDVMAPLATFPLEAAS